MVISDILTVLEYYFYIGHNVGRLHIDIISARILVGCKFSLLFVRVCMHGTFPEASFRTLLPCWFVVRLSTQVIRVLHGHHNELVPLDSKEEVTRLLEKAFPGLSNSKWCK